MANPAPTVALSRRGDPAIPALREVPTSAHAEAAVLGSMIVDVECAPKILGQLGPGDFYGEQNRLIYGVIRALYEQNDGKGVDGLLVRQRLWEKGLLTKIGGGDEDRGLQYLGDVVNTVPSSANAEYYLDIVKEQSRRRFLIGMGQRITEAAYNRAEPVESLLDQAQAEIFAVAVHDRRGDQTVPIGDLAIAAYEDISRREKGMLQGLSSGFFALDEYTCGFRPSDMILIAGRPSMGKTSLALDVVLHAGIVQKKAVAVFSLEMSARQLAERSLCSWAEVETQKAAHGTLTPEEFKKLVDAANEFQKANILLNDASGLTPLELRAKARQLQAQHGIDLIVIDYLQLMDAAGRVESRQQEITLISRQIKAVARELNVPVIALSQLNRGPEGREDHRPRMSDLRDSGSLEQDADVVILLHREDYYHRGEENYVPTHTAEAIVAKQRKGPVGTVKLTFRAPFSRFVNHIEIPAEKDLPPVLQKPGGYEEDPF